MRRPSATPRLRTGESPRDTPGLDSEAALPLEPWEEISGIIERVRRIGGGIEVAIRGKGVLSLSGLGEREARRIPSLSKGTRVSVLRTDLSNRPYVFRIHPPPRGKAAATPGRSPP